MNNPNLHHHHHRPSISEIAINHLHQSSLISIHNFSSPNRLHQSSSIHLDQIPNLITYFKSNGFWATE
ncbi:hypothetical protein QVD17_00092 [Tagetes erecta]|uniref:Uncharacterized protein n=1 Tax=Tagetes erecta TaxID=13708 RepID=A0AAD8L4D5_TARER|nr:hypothetical protein QVD17_00092 [Tagetes erecta]